MKYEQINEKFLLNIEKGEEVIQTVVAFCEDKKITNALVSGIGAVKDLSCGYYNLEEKKYYFTHYQELVEAVSLSGNVMQKEGKLFLHLHGVFTDTENKAFGGHVEKMASGIVLEVVIEPLFSSIERLRNDEIGLFLLNCRN